MLLGFSLLYVRVVLILNGIWLFGRIADREIIIINFFVAGTSFLVALHTAFLGETIAYIRAAAMTLLFAIIYLWVAYDRLKDCDGQGLGWFSLIAAMTVAPMAAFTLMQDHTFAVWLALCWAAWAVLWSMYFLLLAMQMPILKQTAGFTLFCEVFTGWFPGMALLFGSAN